MSKKKKKSGAFLFGLVIVALGAVGHGASQGWLRADEAEALEGVPVRRGPLRISELSRGNLQAKDAERMVNHLEGNATIIFLAEEGTYVKEGDLICELDVSNLEDRSVTQEIEVRSAEASLIKSTEQFQIQEIQNETDTDEADLALMLAKLDMEKFIDLAAIPDDYDPSIHDAPIAGEWAHELAKTLESIKIAKLEQAQAEEKLGWTEELHKKGFVQRTELEGDKLSVERNKIKVEQAEREHELARKYGYQRKLAELGAEVQRRERDILKVKKQAVARLADLEAERESDRYRLERERRRMTEIVEQLGFGEILAPTDGMLVYSRSKGHRGGGGEVPEEGGSAHERQEIATIPQAGGMTVDVSLHETKLDNVTVGQKVLVKVDAIPGRIFEGQVEYVAAVADSGSWMSNPNQRLYKTEVSLTEWVPEMRPGMSCEIEILVDDLESVLYVPRQSVYLDGSKTVCFVNGSSGIETREIQVGLDNSKWVVIEAGLEVGDTVLLAPPASWEPSPDTGDPFEGGKVEAGAPKPDASMGTRAAPQGGGDRSQRGGRGEGGGRGMGGGERGGFGDMSEEDRAAMRKRIEGMTPEERKAEFQKMSGGGGK